MKKLIQYFIISIIAGVSAYGQTTGQFSSTVTWMNNDGEQTRNIEVYVPTDYDQSIEYGLVIGFHGLGDTPSNYMNSTNSVKNFATDPYFEDLIIVCPHEGTSNTSWVVGTEDFGIIKAIKDEISSMYSIRSSLVFVQGFSYGGKSAFLHGLEEADEIAGIIACSPAFYGDEDINNNCTSANCNHHDFNYDNASKIKICTSAGKYYDYPTGEAWTTPLMSSDQSGATWQDSFLGLAMVSAEKINEFAPGHGLFIESTNTSHALPPISITEQCWDFVYPDLTKQKEISVEEEFIIYPNPVRDQLSILNIKEDYEYSIWDINGRIMKSSIIENHNQIDVSNYNSGTYIIQIISSEKVIMRTFIKE
jgi:pimeloyl-ACP methyl ester carboxylesterase